MVLTEAQCGVMFLQGPQTLGAPSCTGAPSLKVKLSSCEANSQQLGDEVEKHLLVSSKSTSSLADLENLFTWTLTGICGSSDVTFAEELTNKMPQAAKIQPS